MSRRSGLLIVQRMPAMWGAKWSTFDALHALSMDGSRAGWLVQENLSVVDKKQ